MNKLKWWGNGNNYHIGDAPSKYVMGAGAAFISKHLESDDEVLADFGVWTGRNLPTLLTLGREVVATDTSEAREAMQIAKNRFPHIKFAETPLTKLPLADQSVGGAICWRVLHNITDAEQMINSLLEINRVLKPNAPLLVAVRHEEDGGWLQRLYSRVKTRPNGAGGWREDVYFTADSLKLLATLLGFKVQLVTTIHEEETIDGHAVKNYYLVAHLLKKKQALDSAWKNLVSRLILRPTTS